VTDNTDLTPDYLGESDLLALGLDPVEVEVLLADRSAVHCEELEDLLWRRRHDRRTGGGQ